MEKKNDKKTNMDHICKDAETLASFMAGISSDCGNCPVVKQCDFMFGPTGCSDMACRNLLFMWLTEPHRNPKIIAIDFDGTLCQSTWPECGEPIMETINRYIKERANGSKFILWTNRVGDALFTALFWCQEHGIYFDAVNDNLPEVINEFGTNPRKIFANEYWDDRMVCLEHLKRPEGVN